MKKPDVGIFTGLTFEDYLAIPAINKSALDLIRKSPLHYWAQYLDPQREPPKETPALKLGKAIHAAILEPESFERNYRKRPKPEDYPSALNTADQYKAACKSLELKVSGTKDELKLRLKEASTNFRFFDEIEAGFAGYILLTESESEACTRISTTVRSCPAAKEILSEGDAEVVIVWQDPETGAFCKGRLDWLTKDRGVMVDFKSTEDASAVAFGKSSFNYGYHRQAAWYTAGLAALGFPGSLFVFPVYETSRPYASAFYYAPEEMIALGRAEMSELLDRYVACSAKNEWPGFPQELKPVELPKWAVRGEKPVNQELETY